MEKRIYKYGRPFRLESGEVLPEIEICYHISADYSSSSSKRVIWITHALTANSNPEEWWDTLTGEGKFFDPRKYTIVCANLLGSCYGSTGPLSINPSTGIKYGSSFPTVTVRDEVNFLELLRKSLGISEIDLLIGGSVGGYQAMEWCIMYPEVIKNAALIACDARISPWGSAFNESQRMILDADESIGKKKGLAAARSVALISYRSYEGYNLSQKERDAETLLDHRVRSYQRHQGEKLTNRFDADSYLRMLDVSDSHNIGRGRGGVIEALKLIKANVLCIGIDSDILFPVEEQKFMAENIRGAKFTEITSAFGHDGFLLENKQIEEAIKCFIDHKNLTTKLCRY